MSKHYNITPFTTIRGFLKAIIIIDKLFCHTKQNIPQLHKCICDLIEKISLADFQIFHSMVITYPKNYPFELINDIEKFNIEIIEYTKIQQINSKTLVSNAAVCIFCDDKNEDWFDYITPRFQKDPILFSVNSIGI